MQSVNSDLSVSVISQIFGNITVVGNWDCFQVSGAALRGANRVHPVLEWQFYVICTNGYPLHFQVTSLHKIILYVYMDPSLVL